MTNAANQVLRVELTGHMWLPCAAHTLQLASNDAFDSNHGIQLLLKDLQDIVAHIKRSEQVNDCYMVFKTNLSNRIIRWKPQINIELLQL